METPPANPGPRLPASTPTVKLRRALTASRAVGLDWSDAWPLAVAAAIAGLTPEQQSDAFDALASAHATWRAAYLHAPFGRCRPPLLSA